ncbi:MAG: tetratricopeptide (TPR) repeat protein [Mariniblastus sp.]|jgi:tetratricopeptide (TPR) repeat protein
MFSNSNFQYFGSPRLSITLRSWTLLTALAGCTLITGLADGQTEATARVTNTSWQDTDLTPSTGLVTKDRVNSIYDRISKIEDRMKMERLLSEQARQKENERLQTQIEAINTPPVNEAMLPGDLPGNSRSDSADLLMKTIESLPVAAKPVMAKPINPFKLGNSLFKTGNISAARRSYDSALAEADSDEKTWLKCLIACCYRLEGDFESAETTFREVTHLKTGFYAVDHANWSLDYLEQRRNSLQQFQAIEAEIDGVIEAMNEVKEN